ncbi:MAG: trypsin-like serine peptidase [Mongoliitalea sp.]
MIADNHIELNGEEFCKNSIIIHPNFNWRKVNYDFGVIIIPKSSTKKKPKNSVFKIERNFELQIGEKLNIAGFPANNGYDGTVMTFEDEICEKFTTKRIIHNFNTNTGNSGSPIWVEKDSIRYLVGIHTYSKTATRIDKEYIDLIYSWIKK